MKAFVILVLSSFSFLSVASKSSLDPNEIMKSVNDILTTGTNCIDLIEKFGGGTCSKLTDNFCDKLWNPKNKGNYKIGKSHFKLGFDKNKNFSLIDRMSIDAFANSINNLPKSYQDKLAPALKKIQAHVEKEAKSKKWFEDFSEMVRDFQKGKRDLVYENFYQRYPKAKDKDDDDYSVEENEAYAAAAREVEDNIIKAKYEKHPNWKRVQKVYASVKKNILSELEKLNLSDDLKKRLVKKVSSIELSLPYLSMDKLGAEYNCSNSQVNAFYTPVSNKFTVCAGLFNGFQSEATLHYVIGHELAHAVDPQILMDDELKNSTAYKFMEELVKNPEMSCEDFAKKRDQVVNELRDDSIKKNPLEKLSQCLIDKSRLRPITMNDLIKVSQDNAYRYISSVASGYNFTYLASKERTKLDGTTVKNPLYLNPTLVDYQAMGYQKKGEMQDPHPIFHVFTKNLRCIARDKFEEVGSENRPKVFELAIESTRSFLSQTLLNQYLHCGTECSGLRQYQMSKISGENFADWLSYKAMVPYLKSLKSKEEAKQVASEVGSFYCERPSVYSKTQDLMMVEKGFSYQQHGQNRVRRLAFFTDEIRSVIGCVKTETVPGEFSQCQEN